MKKNLLILVLPLYLASNVYATNSHVELSYVQTKGSSETTTFSAKASTKYTIDTQSWIDGKLDGIYGESNNITSSNKYDIDAKYNRNTNEVLYYFIGLNYKVDKLSTSYDYRIAIGPGLGYKVLKDEIKELDLKAGINYAKEELKNGNTDNYAAGTTEVEYKHKINANMNFTQSIKYDTSFDDADNYIVNSKTGLAVKMSDTLSLGVSYDYDYTNQAANDKSDTKFLTSLIIDF